jgi:hypothetical protein
MGEEKPMPTLALDGEQLSGTISGAEGTSDLKQAKLAGNVVPWNTDITSPMPLTLEFSGTVEGGAIAGQVKLGMFGNAPFTGVPG